VAGLETSSSCLKPHKCCWVKEVLQKFLHSDVRDWSTTTGSICLQSLQLRWHNQLLSIRGQLLFHTGELGVALCSLNKISIPFVVVNNASLYLILGFGWRSDNIQYHKYWKKSNQKDGKYFSTALYIHVFTYSILTVCPFTFSAFEVLQKGPQLWQEVQLY
jgi:hypothetical protein